MSDTNVSLEQQFMAMVHAHNQMGQNLRAMYYELVRQGCDLPTGFEAPDACFDVAEGSAEAEKFENRTFFGLQRMEPSAEQVATRQDGPIRTPVTEIHSSGIVITTLAQTKDGKVIVAGDKHGEQHEDRRDNSDAIDVEVREGGSLKQLREVVEQIDRETPVPISLDGEAKATTPVHFSISEPEPIVPDNFSLAAACKVEVTPIVKQDFKKTLQDLLRQYVSTTVFMDGMGKWEPEDVYSDEVFSVPHNLLINWPSGFYRGYGGNALVINIQNEVVFVFGKNYTTFNIESTDKCFVVAKDETGRIITLNEETDENVINTHVPILKRVLETYFKINTQPAA